MAELARRYNVGLDVVLESLGDTLRVTVTDFFADTDSGFVLETTSGKRALEMFYHPFAYYKDRVVSPPRQAMNELWPAA